MDRAECLNRAKECVLGQREQDYGSPENNFRTIAEFWSAYKGVEFTAGDVAMMMALLKVARISTGVPEPPTALLIWQGTLHAQQKSLLQRLYTL